MGSPVFLHAIWNGTGSIFQPLDFGNLNKDALETCRLNLLHTYMNCTCHLRTIKYVFILTFFDAGLTISDGSEYTSGGMLLANCIEWGIRPADYESTDL